MKRVRYCIVDPDFNYVTNWEGEPFQFERLKNARKAFKNRIWDPDLSEYVGLMLVRETVEIIEEDTHG